MMKAKLPRNFTNFCALCALLLSPVAEASADAKIRQAQEELRKRNLYFGDVDGMATAELAASLKRYQERKGFAVTGQVDATTAGSLGISFDPQTLPAEVPEGPILKSDIARDLSAEERIALEERANPDVTVEPMPVPPAESPAPSQDLSRERVQQFVERYLLDAETDDVAAQVRDFAYPVAPYFVHGSKGADFIRKDVARYVKNWPERNYELIGPVSFVASGKDGETMVEFTIAYQVRNGKRSDKGQTRNFWKIRPEGDELKIVAIYEERVKPTASTAGE